MNPTLSAQETTALLKVLDRGLVLIRATAAGGDAARAEAIADALHNVPRLMLEGEKWGWSISGFREMSLAPLFERYPDLVGLGEPFDGP